MSEDEKRALLKGAFKIKIEDENLRKKLQEYPDTYYGKMRKLRELDLLISAEDPRVKVYLNKGFSIQGIDNDVPLKSTQYYKILRDPESTGLSNNNERSSAFRVGDFKESSKIRTSLSKKEQAILDNDLPKDSMLLPTVEVVGDKSKSKVPVDEYGVWNTRPKQESNGITNYYNSLFSSNYQYVPSEEIQKYRDYFKGIGESDLKRNPEAIGTIVRELNRTLNPELVETTKKEANPMFISQDKIDLLRDAPNHIRRATTMEKIDDVADYAEQIASLVQLGSTPLVWNPIGAAVNRIAWAAGLGIDAYQAARAAYQKRGLGAAVNMAELALGLTPGAKLLSKNFGSAMNKFTQSIPAMSALGALQGLDGADRVGRLNSEIMGEEYNPLDYAKEFLVSGALGASLGAGFSSIPHIIKTYNKNRKILNDSYGFKNLGARNYFLKRNGKVPESLIYQNNKVTQNFDDLLAGNNISEDHSKFVSDIQNGAFRPKGKFRRGIEFIGDHIYPEWRARRILNNNLGRPLTEEEIKIASDWEASITRGIIDDLSQMNKNHINSESLQQGINNALDPKNNTIIASPKNAVLDLSRIHRNGQMKDFVNSYGIKDDERFSFYDVYKDNLSRLGSESGVSGANLLLATRNTPKNQYMITAHELAHAGDNIGTMDKLKNPDYIADYILGINRDWNARGLHRNPEYILEHPLSKRSQREVGILKKREIPTEDIVSNAFVPHIEKYGEKATRQYIKDLFAVRNKNPHKTWEDTFYEGLSDELAKTWETQTKNSPIQNLNLRDLGIIERMEKFGTLYTYNPSSNYYRYLYSPKEWDSNKVGHNVFSLMSGVPTGKVSSDFAPVDYVAGFSSHLPPALKAPEISKQAIKEFEKTKELYKVLSQL